MKNPSQDNTPLPDGYIIDDTAITNEELILKIATFYTNYQIPGWDHRIPTIHDKICTMSHYINKHIADIQSLDCKMLIIPYNIDAGTGSSGFNINFYTLQKNTYMLRVLESGLKLQKNNDEHSLYGGFNFGIDNVPLSLIRIIPEQLFKYYLHSLPNYSYRAKQLFLCLFITDTEIIKDETINPEGRVAFCNAQNIHKINIDVSIYNTLSEFTKLTIANMFIDIINEYILHLDICCIKK